MRMRGLAAVLLIVCAIPGAAQLSAPVAMSTRADSLAELARLDGLVGRTPENAAAWHARGLLAWQLSQGKRAIGTKVDRDQLRLNQIADSSLLRAATLGADNARYLADVAIYRSQGSPTVRGGATRFENRAFERARATGDSMIVAEMADRLGQVEFKDYQMFFGRRMALANGPGNGIADILVQQSGAHGAPNVVAPQSGDGFGGVSASVDLVRQSIEQRSVPLGGNPPPGVDAYEKALHYFEVATSAAPALPLPWRHRFAALADRQRWEELELAARARAAVAPWDPDGWLALGLSLHRAAHPGAMVAFDSAFAQMSDSTRRRLDRVERIMRPKAVKALEALPAAERARTERFVWTAADPLWSVPGNEVRAEYLARVAFAELRFTDEENGLHGVDTYPGDLHVRYGFPKYSTNWVCADEARSDVCWFWWYAPRLQFIVRYVAAFNRGLAFSDDIAGNEDVQFQVPASWTSIPGVPPIDSIPLRVARFRADGAKPTVFVSATLPLPRMSVGGVAPRALMTRLWMFADSTDAVVRDSSRADDAGLVQFRLSAPAGDLYARAEAVTPDASAARGTAFSSSPPVTTGLTMSDVLIAASATDAGAPATRWHELRITPAPDAIPNAHDIAIAWETYGLAARDGAQHYSVRLIVEKSSKSITGRIVAQIAGLVGSQRGDERVTLGFDRDTPARAVTLDHLSLSLRQTPAGRYTLAVEITDKLTGAKTRRLTTILIGQ